MPLCHSHHWNQKLEWFCGLEAVGLVTGQVEVAVQGQFLDRVSSLKTLANA